MKLSIWTICEYLKDKGFDLESHINEGHPSIEIVALSRSRSYSNDHAEIFQQGENAVLAFDMDYVNIIGADCMDAANAINECISFYNSWETELCQAMLTDASLQDLLEIADKVFQRPMFIKNDSTKTFAVSKGYSKDVHPFWERILSNLERGVPDYEQVSLISKDAEFRAAFQERYPSVRWSPSYNKMVLHANVFEKERRVAEIVVLENDKPFDNGAVHVLNVFVELIESYVNHNINIFQSGSDVELSVQSLLEGGEASEDAARTVYRYIGLGAGEEFILLVANSISYTDSPALSVLREKLETQLKEAIVIPYKSAIVALLGMNGMSYNEMIIHLQSYIPKEDFCWAISYEFKGLGSLAGHYAYTREILEMAIFSKEHYTTMYEMAPELVAKKFEELADPKALIHPDVVRLNEYDLKENTQYCLTLFYFLLCGSNYTDASKVMMLHRNTLIYRINKIRDIAHTNIDDIKNRRLLLCSFLLLGKKYQ